MSISDSCKTTDRWLGVFLVESGKKVHVGEKGTFETWEEGIRANIGIWIARVKEIERIKGDLETLRRELETRVTSDAEPAPSQ